MSSKIKKQRPSENETDLWLKAYNKNCLHPQAVSGEERKGYFCIFLHVYQLDEAWRAVKHETRAGNLGYLASVRTIKYDPDERVYEKKVICVFTYDPSDFDDRDRVYEVLINMGFSDDQLYYKIKID